MLHGRRKSIQPMAERLPDGNQQNLQQCVNHSPWDPEPVQRRIAERMMPLISPDAFRGRRCVLPKDGRMSVAVTRQYCGALGKQANSQAAVSDTASVLLRWRLFLPWEAESQRQQPAGSDYARHRGSGGWRWMSWTVSRVGPDPLVVVADAGYGQSHHSRAGTDQAHRRTRLPRYRDPAHR